MQDFRFKENTTHGSAYFPFAYYNVTEKKWTGVSPHWHSEIEIIYWKNGKGEIFINKDKFQVSEEAFFIINKEFLHSIFVQSAVEESAIVFNPMMLSFLQPDFINQNILLPLSQGEISFIPLINKTSKCFFTIKELYQEIENTYLLYGKNLTKSVYGQVVIKSNLLKIIGLLYENGSIHDNFLNKSELDKIKKILIFIDNNYEKKITINDLSSMLNFNPQYFCRFFKSVVGTSPMSYLLKIRLNNSINKIVNSNSSVTEIALNCGFANSSHFIREFKKYTSLTPLKYRELHKKKKS